MDYLTIHAASAEEALRLAAERFRVDADCVDCYELSPEEASEETGGPEGSVPSEETAESPSGVERSGVAAEGLAAFRARVYPEFWEDEARSWVQGLMERFGILSEVRVQTVGTQVFVRLSCPEPSILIGRQGHTLDAFQHIVTRALATQWPAFPEVVVDVESYKEKKLQRLERAARSAAQRAIRFGKSQDLEPMTASERKYIHNALKDIEEVRTVSYGREPNRHVVVEPVNPSPRGGEDDSPRDEESSHRRRRPVHERRRNDSPRGSFRRPLPPPAEGSESDEPSTEETFEDTLNWRPTFFKPPETTPTDPGEPFPDVEDDLHS